jgi:hypothetical protein
LAAHGSCIVQARPDAQYIYSRRCSLPYGHHSEGTHPGWCADRRTDRRARPDRRDRLHRFDAGESHLRAEYQVRCRNGARIAGLRQFQDQAAVLVANPALIRDFSQAAK